MSDKDRDAWAEQFKKQREEDKKPQFEKDISEINATIKKLEKKLVAR